MHDVMHKLGHTRGVNRRDHLLQTPDTFVRITLPGLQGGVAVVHVSPAVGAGFTQCTVELETEGTLTATAAQRFVYVLEGSVDLATGNSFKTMSAGGYAYLASGAEHTFTARDKARLAVIEKDYEALDGILEPAMLIGKESDVAAVALMGDTDLEVRSLLPDTMNFDFAVNTMTYQPGAALSMVEMHVMEHGCLMLEGGGIYRLSEEWYPVTGGDFIWMAAYCPQWFGAIGKQPAKYLIYKNWNRNPLG
jgi:(S)-ureidoglycine aminohydrolase